MTNPPTPQTLPAHPPGPPPPLPGTHPAARSPPRLGCAHSTVSAYLRDFQHPPRQYILETFARRRQAGRPGPATGHRTRTRTPREHQQHVAAARELRLLLGTLCQGSRPDRNASAQTPRAPPRSARPPPPARNSTGPDGHSRDEHGRCRPRTVRCAGPRSTKTWRPGSNNSPLQHRTRPRTNSSLPAIHPPKSPPNPDQIQTRSEQIRTIPEPESPVPGDEFVPPAQESRPQPKIGPQYPASWDNPYGYIYEPERDPLLQRMFGRR